MKWIWGRKEQESNNKPIGASEGKEAYYIRIEYSGGSIHGHPINEEEFKSEYKHKISDPKIRKKGDLPLQDAGY
ncbi:hypothetical protein [Kroppenstedtia pulmonis]|uniref:hypothetical protein n=1 Tax=Kroppenstedtia pulmonis TaxID=1380685 RepID=UPI001564F379|nr:hypothetical protein [Kroppenstedtia pulmonis]